VISIASAQDIIQIEALPAAEQSEHSAPSGEALNKNHQLPRDENTKSPNME
jgi:hypothetical protein